MQPSRVPLMMVGMFASAALGAFLATAWQRPAGARAKEPAGPAWLAGSTDEKFAQAEKHLRGLDVSMWEIGYRYEELLHAARDRNWDYAQYQIEKIELSLRLALERRPKRVASSKPFLDKSLPPVLAAVKKKDGKQLDRAMEALYQGCVECHRAEKVLHFKGAVDRIKARVK